MLSVSAPSSNKTVEILVRSLETDREEVRPNKDLIGALIVSVSKLKK